MSNGEVGRLEDGRPLLHRVKDDDTRHHTYYLAPEHASAAHPQADTQLPPPTTAPVKQPSFASPSQAERQTSPQAVGHSRSPSPRLGQLRTLAHGGYSRNPAPRLAQSRTLAQAGGHSRNRSPKLAQSQTLAQAQTPATPCMQRVAQSAHPEHLQTPAQSHRQILLHASKHGPVMPPAGAAPQASMQAAVNLVHSLAAQTGLPGDDPVNAWASSPPHSPASGQIEGQAQMSEPTLDDGGTSGPLLTPGMPRGSGSLLTPQCSEPPGSSIDEGDLMLVRSYVLYCYTTKVLQEATDLCTSFVSAKSWYSSPSLTILGSTPKQFQVSCEVVTVLLLQELGGK